MDINGLLNTISQESINSLVKDIRKNRKNKEEVITIMTGMKDEHITMHIFFG